MGKTIITHLLSNSPDGIKKVWVDNKNCQCIYLTRTDLKVAKDRKELNQPALYFLFGEDEKDGEDKKVYIGQTENFNKRITYHNSNKKKDFWNEVLVFTARDNFLSKADVQYLECLAIQKTKEFKNYSLEENKQDPSFPTLEENRIETVKDFFNEIIFLTSFLNFNIFEDYEEKRKTEEKKEQENLWFCKERNITAKGVYTGKKFIVLAGSQMVKNSVPSLMPSIIKKRNSLLENPEEVIDKGEYVVLKKNMEFGSPSFAAAFCLGRISNGWHVWKNENSKTMDEVLRSN